MDAWSAIHSWFRKHFQLIISKRPWQAHPYQSQMKSSAIKTTALGLLFKQLPVCPVTARGVGGSQAYNGYECSRSSKVLRRRCSTHYSQSLNVSSPVQKSLNFVRKCNPHWIHNIETQYYESEVIWIYSFWIHLFEIQTWFRYNSVLFSTVFRYKNFNMHSSWLRFKP